MPPDNDKDQTPEVVSSEQLAEAPLTGTPIQQPTGPINNPREEQMPPDQSTPTAPVAPAKPQITAATTAKPATEAKPKGLSNFLKLTGLKESELMSYNPDSLTGVSKAGGKYQMNSKGSQLRHLAGPRPPSVTAEEDEARRQAEIEARENARAGAE